MPGTDDGRGRGPDLWSAPPVVVGGDTVGEPPRAVRPFSWLRSTGWFIVGAALPPAVLLFPVGLLVLPLLLVAVGVLCTRGPAWPEVVALGFGLSAVCGAAAYGNTLRPDCPPSGVRRIGPGEFASCFESVLFRTDLWAAGSAALLGGSLALTALTVVRRRRAASTASWLHAGPPSPGTGGTIR